MTYSEKDQSDQVKASLMISWDSRATRIIAVAVANDEDKNHYVNIPTSFGTPLTPALYNQVGDYYEFCCFDFYEIGTVPFSLSLEMDKMIDWNKAIPLPYSIIESNLDKKTIEDFNLWKKKFPEPDFGFYFLQMLGSY